MPRPAEDETGAPSVYQHQGGPAPEYEEYRDPAFAHGWLNAYDETSELPRIAPAAPGPGRAERRRAAARGTGGPRAKHVAVAVGAVGAASVAALIAGFAFSSSPDGTRGEQNRTKHTAGESSQSPQESPRGASVTPSPKSDAASPATGAASGSAATATAGSSASANPSPSTVPTRSASGTPSPTAVTTTPTYGGHGWGHGRGGGRGR
ncbi:hypothetical protein [Streptomyces sp. NPDC101234]|uniref:hypothetical protein n=1 Tax=Streptomyces sp. NPDC101234 TaxID=3366138 RepID=UPI00380E229F